MVTLNAHFDGKTIVVDEPVDLPFPSGAKLRLTVEKIEDAHQASSAGQQFMPLDLEVDPEFSKAVALDPRFNIEES
jgi:hypothetical protein